MAQLIGILLYTIFIVMFIPYIHGEPDATNNDNEVSDFLNNTNGQEHKAPHATLPITTLTPAPSTTASTIQPINTSLSLPVLERMENNINKPPVITSVSVEITDNEGNRMNQSVPVQTATEYLVSLSDEMVSALVPSSKNPVPTSKDSNPYNIILVQGYDKSGKKLDRIAKLYSINLPKEIIPEPLVTQPREQQSKESQSKESILDVFGIKKIYPTKPGGEIWFMNMKDVNDDPRFEMRGGVEKMVKNSDGSWSPLPNDKVRLAVYTSDAKGKFNEDNPPTLNLKKLASIGHWYKENDWLNIEMTGYFKLNSANDMGSGYSLFSRSAGHGDADGGCGGATPKFNFGFDGQLKAKKEMWHVSLVNSEGMTDEDLSKSFKGKWIGIKAIIYNLPNGDVRQEFWMDKDNKGKFEKLYVFTDSGEFGEKGSAGPEKCGGQWDQKYTWGSPKAVFRWDEADVSFKYLSVREIVPPINIRLLAS